MVAEGPHTAVGVEEGAEGKTVRRAQVCDAIDRPSETCQLAKDLRSHV